MDDLISRQAVMWRLTNLAYTQCKTQGEADVIDTAKTLVITMPSAQPDYSNEVKFWKERAEFYEKTCFDILNDINKGGKISSVEINENGIIFTMEQEGKRCQWIKSGILPTGKKLRCQSKRRRDGSARNAVSNAEDLGNRLTLTETR